jgi:hypothetical protein
MTNHMQGEIIFSVQSHRKTAIMRALGFSSFTVTDTLDELKTMICDAVSCHFDAAEKPSVIRLHMLKDEVILAGSFSATAAAKNSFDPCLVLATYFQP